MSAADRLVLLKIDVVAPEGTRTVPNNKYDTRVLTDGGIKRVSVIGNDRHGKVDSLSVPEPRAPPNNYRSRPSETKKSFSVKRKT